LVAILTGWSVLASAKPAIFCSFQQKSRADRWVKAVLIMDQFVGASGSNGVYQQ
jgi:hypothetical protein